MKYPCQINRTRSDVNVHQIIDNAGLDVAFVFMNEQLFSYRNRIYYCVLQEWRTLTDPC